MQPVRKQHHEGRFLPGCIGTAVILAAMVPACCAASSNDTFYGDGTYYGQGNDAASWCRGNGHSTGYPGLPTVALNSVQFDFGGSFCGKCLQGSGTGTGLGGTPIGKFLVTVNNLCPECKQGDLDFAQSGDGRWKIKWRIVDCAKAVAAKSRSEGLASGGRRLLQTA